MNSSLYFDRLNAGDGASMADSSVIFALPFDVACEDCGSLLRKGARLSAVKRVQYVSSDGRITRSFDMSCTSCGASLSFSSPGSEEYHMSGAAIEFQRCRTKVTVDTNERAGTDASHVESRNITSRESRVASDGKRRSGTSGDAARSIAELESLIRNRATRLADMPKAIASLEEAHRQKWDRTPLRAKSQEAMENARQTRKAARIAHAPTRKASASKLTFTGQRSRTGRMEHDRFLSARAAIRKLNRGGALKHLRRSFSQDQLD